MVYNYPITDFCPKGVNKDTKLSEADFNKVIEKFEQDEFMQNACAQVYNNKFLSKEKYEQSNNELEK